MSFGTLVLIFLRDCINSQNHRAYKYDKMMINYINIEMNFALMIDISLSTIFFAIIINLTCLVYVHDKRFFYFEVMR